MTHNKLNIIIIIHLGNDYAIYRRWPRASQSVQGKILFIFQHLKLRRFFLLAFKNAYIKNNVKRSCVGIEFEEFMANLWQETQELSIFNDRVNRYSIDELLS